MCKFLNWLIGTLHRQESAPDIVLTRLLTRNMLLKTKITQKRVRNGAIIIITAKNPQVVKKIKHIISTSVRLPYCTRLNPGQSLELLRTKQITKSILFLSNGIKLGLTSRHPEWITRIHHLDIKHRDHLRINPVREMIRRI